MENVAIVTPLRNGVMSPVLRERNTPFEADRWAKGGRRVRNTPSKMESSAVVAETLLPGTPKVYDTVQPASFHEAETQAERLVRFKMQLDQFKTVNEESPTSLRSPAERELPKTPRDRIAEEIYAESPPNGVIRMIRPQLEGTPQSLKRSNLSDHPNELKRTPLGLSRHRAWRLSGLNNNQSPEPIYATINKVSEEPKPLLVEATYEQPSVSPHIVPMDDRHGAQKGVTFPEQIDDTWGGARETPEPQPAADDVFTPEPSTFFHSSEVMPTPYTAANGFTATPRAARIMTPPRARDEYVDVEDVATPGNPLGENYLELVGDETPYSIVEDVADQLIEAPTAGCDLSVVDVEPTKEVNAETQQMFEFAACGGIQFITETLNRRMVHINDTDCKGRSALMYSLQYAQYECAEFLLGKGADPNVQDDTGSAALHYASQGVNHHTVKLLLKNGANTKLLDSEQRSALHWAMRSPSTKIVSSLMTKCNESDVNAPDINSMTPLMWAAYYGKPSHIVKLRAAGALAEAEDNTGRTALHWSLFSGSYEAVKYLNTYERTFAQDIEGKSALHFACEAGFDKAIKLILKTRPQAVHDIDLQGRTPLHWASACKHHDSVTQLLQHGAHPTRIDSEGKTALDYAESMGSEKVYELLREHDSENGEQPRLGPAGASTSIRSFECEGGMGEMDDDARYLLHQLAAGSKLSKYSNSGRGPLQKRFFWLDCFTGELCWTKTISKSAKDTNQASSAYLFEIRRQPSETVQARADYDSEGKHKYAFELICEDRTLDLVAATEKDMNLWVEGLQMLKDYAIHVLEDKTAKGMGSYCSPVPEPQEAESNC